MKRLRRREPQPEVTVAPGERVLAWTRTTDGGVLAGTRDAMYLPHGVRLPWEQVESADWDVDAERLVVAEVGTWGQERAVHELAVAEPRTLLELVRERVTASIVLQRHVPVHGKRGVRVIGRRAPSGRHPVVWLTEYDVGVEPDDPAAARAAADALDAARLEVGESGP